MWVLRSTLVVDATPRLPVTMRGESQSAARVRV